MSFAGETWLYRHKLKHNNNFEAVFSNRIYFKFLLDIWTGKQF